MAILQFHLATFVTFWGLQVAPFGALGWDQIKNNSSTYSNTSLPYQSMTSFLTAHLPPSSYSNVTHMSTRMNSTHAASATHSSFIQPSSSVNASTGVATTSVYPHNTTASSAMSSVSLSTMVSSSSSLSVKSHSPATTAMSNTSATSPTPSKTQTAAPSSKVSSAQMSTAKMSSSAIPTSKPSPHVEYECGPECKSLKKRLWVAGFFAVLFAIVSVIVGVLFVRQRRLAADSSDPALSRLI